MKFTTSRKHQTNDLDTKTNPWKNIPVSPLEYLSLSLSSENPLLPLPLKKTFTQKLPKLSPLLPSKISSGSLSSKLETHPVFLSLLPLLFSSLLLKNVFPNSPKTSLSLPLLYLIPSETKNLSLLSLPRNQPADLPPLLCQPPLLPPAAGNLPITENTLP